LLIGYRAELSQSIPAAGSAGRVIYALKDLEAWGRIVGDEEVAIRDGAAHR
jgi:hypothetical protein